MTPCDPCGEIDCVIPSDYSLYDLEDCIPGPTTNPFINEAVYFPITPCSGGASPSFTGTLPSWITLDTVNIRFVGASGTFSAQSVAAATLVAQTALNSFGAAQVAAGNLVCTNIYAIQGYFSGMIANSGTSNCTSGEWDGKFHSFDANNDGNGYGWFATNQIETNNCVLVDGFDICMVNVTWHSGTWTLQFGTGTGTTLWYGLMDGPQDSPEGVYNYDHGIDPGPDTLTIIKVGGVPDAGSMNCGD